MFVFNNISSKDMEVIVEEEENFLGRAGQRYEQTEIDGRNGAIFEEKGYSVVERTIKVQILNIEKIDKILAWLNGVGILEYKNRITIARFYNEVSPERVANIKIAEVSFIRNPFWNKKRDDFTEVRDIITNEGNIYSEPIIRLIKKDSELVDITINGTRFIYNFDNEDYVEIECEKHTAECEKINRNRNIQIGYIFPTLDPGENKILINAGEAKIEIKRKDRWL